MMGEAKKKSARRENREAALQFLYMWDINPHEVFNFALSDFFEHQARPRDYYAFAEALVCGVVDHQQEIDITIQKYTQNWAFSRIAKVDLAILRLALYELFHCLDIPPIVSINEAIDLSKEFSHEDSKRFINGILDKVRADLKRPSRKPADDDA
tara:strand:+ start:914 stop:1375 length:462 start_codon:yes stop_codon:yes gene_type:complete